MFRVGRVQRQVRRCLIAHNGPVPFSELLDWAYLNRRPWRWQVHRAVKRYGTSPKRGWWQANPELMRKIRGTY